MTTLDPLIAIVIAISVVGFVGLGLGYMLRAVHRAAQEIASLRRSLHPGGD